MPTNSLRVVARVTAKPDAVETIREVLRGLIEPTRREPGCVSYVLLQNKEEPADFTFVEEWESDSLFEGHFSTEHVRKALPRLQELATVDIRRYSVLA